MINIKPPGQTRCKLVSTVFNEAHCHLINGMDGKYTMREAWRARPQMMRSTYGIHRSCTIQNAQYVKSIRGYAVEILQYVQLHILKYTCCMLDYIWLNNLKPGGRTHKKVMKTSMWQDSTTCWNSIHARTCALPSHIVPEKLIKKWKWLVFILLLCVNTHSMLFFLTVLYEIKIMCAHAYTDWRHE